MCLCLRIQMQKVRSQVRDERKRGKNNPRGSLANGIKLRLDLEKHSYQKYTPRMTENAPDNEQLIIAWGSAGGALTGACHVRRESRTNGVRDARPLLRSSSVVFHYCFTFGPLPVRRRTPRMTEDDIIICRYPLLFQVWATACQTAHATHDGRRPRQ